MDAISPATDSQPLQLLWSGETNLGKVRPHNEDAFLGLQFSAEEIHRLGKIGDARMGNTDFVFAVSDGMGGAKAGEFASRVAVDKITMLLPSFFRQSASGLAGGFEDVLTELFDQIHRALMLLGRSDEDCKGMETTLSLCWFSQNRMYFAHIGDSRIYYRPAGGALKRLTEDDTHVDWLFRTGKINEREARTHPRRKVLQKALGGDNQFVNPQLGAVICEPGDTFLLCTDGLVEGLYDERVAEYLDAAIVNRPDDALARRMVMESLEKDGGDNLTALIVRVA